MPGKNGSVVQNAGVLPNHYRRKEWDQCINVNNSKATQFCCQMVPEKIRRSLLSRPSHGRPVTARQSYFVHASAVVRAFGPYWRSSGYLGSGGCKWEADFLAGLPFVMAPAVSQGNSTTRPEYKPSWADGSPDPHHPGWISQQFQHTVSS